MITNTKYKKKIKTRIRMKRKQRIIIIDHKLIMKKKINNIGDLFFFKLWIKMNKKRDEKKKI